MPAIFFVIAAVFAAPILIYDCFCSNAETFVKFRKDIRDYDARRAKVLEEKIY